MKKIFFISLLLISGCATTSDFETLKADVNQLKKDTFDIQKDISEIKTDLTDLKEKTTGVVKEDALNAVRESEASLRSDIMGISKDIQTLMGRFDENKYSIEKYLKDKSSEIDLLRSQMNTLEAQLKEMQTTLTARLLDIEKKGKTEIKKDTKTETQETKPDEPKTPEIKDPTKLYEAAHNAFKEKKYKEARDKFEAFLKEFPQDKLAGNAQFWIGETYFAEEDHAGAIVEYDILLKNYPNSEKAPAALLKQGYSFVEMGDKKAAKGIFEQLKEKYPKSKEAELAKRKIEELSKRGK